MKFTLCFCPTNQPPNEKNVVRFPLLEVEGQDPRLCYGKDTQKNRHAILKHLMNT